jgi:hypothetical protein
MRRLITYLNSLFLGVILGMIYVAIIHTWPPHSPEKIRTTRIATGNDQTRCGQEAGTAFSVLPITAAAIQLPTTFIIVRPMSISVSTPRISRMGAVGRCTALAVASNTTSEARGTPAMPLLAAINTSTIASCRPNER